MEFIDEIDNTSKKVNYSFSSGSEGVRRTVEISYIHSDEHCSTRLARGGSGSYSIDINNGGLNVRVDGIKNDVKVISKNSTPIYISRKMFADKTLNDHFEEVNYSIIPVSEAALLKTMDSENRKILLALRNADSDSAILTNFDENAIRFAAVKVWRAAYKRLRESNGYSYATEETEKVLAKNGFFSTQFFQKGDSLQDHLDDTPQAGMVHLVNDIEIATIEDILEQNYDSLSESRRGIFGDLNKEVAAEYVDIKTKLFKRDPKETRRDFLSFLIQGNGNSMNLVEQINNPMMNYVLLSDRTLDLQRLSTILLSKDKTEIESLDDDNTAALSALQKIRNYDGDIYNASKLLDIFYEQSGLNPQKNKVVAVSVRNEDNITTYKDTCVFYSNDEVFDTVEQRVLRARIKDKENSVTIDQVYKMVIDAYYLHPRSRTAADIILTQFKDMAEDKLYDIKEQIFGARLDSLFLRDQNIIHMKLYEFMRSVFEASIETEVKADSALNGFIESLKDANKQGLTSEITSSLLTNYVRCDQRSAIEQVLMSEVTDIDQELNRIRKVGSEMSAIDGLLYNNDSLEMNSVKEMYQELIDGIGKVDQAAVIDRTLAASIVPDEKVFGEIHAAKHYFESLRKGLFEELFVKPLVEGENVFENTRKAAASIFEAFEAIDGDQMVVKQEYDKMKQELEAVEAVDNVEDEEQDSADSMISVLGDFI